jgi:hypothetical protein
MGGGKSSGSSAPVVTQEQKDAIAAQTNFLTGTALPAYQQTISGAQGVYGQVNPYATKAAQNAYENAASVSNAQQSIGGELVGAGRNLATAGTGGVLNTANQMSTAANQLGYAGGGGTKNVADLMSTGGQNMATYGTNKLMGLFSPDYKTEQIQASLQPAREAIREQQAGQNAMYGAAGGLGSSRMALADKNLSQLGQQRLQSAAAQTSAAVEAQRQQAANTFLGTGAQGLSTAGNLYGNLLTGGLGAGSTAGNLYGNLLTSGLGSAGAGANLMGQSVDTSGKAIGYAASPMDLYNKYASVVYGTPQASTTPNFAGTQGANTSSKGFRI